TLHHAYGWPRHTLGARRLPRPRAVPSGADCGAPLSRLRARPGRRHRDCRAPRGAAMSIALVTSAVRTEQDVVWARQRARQICALLGFELQDQARIATAVSEIARN